MQSSRLRARIHRLRILSSVTPLFITTRLISIEGSGVCFSPFVRRLGTASRSFARFVVCGIACVLPVAVSAQKAPPPPGFIPGAGTRTDLKPYYFSIPAPRGQILDRKGRPLAQNVAVQRLQLSVPDDQRSTLEKYKAWLLGEMEKLRDQLPAGCALDEASLKRHFENRRDLPFTICDHWDGNKAISLKDHPHVHLRTVYERHYPERELAAHILGYIASDGPPPAGPVLHNEPLWQRTRGATGLEAAFNKQLTGTDGTLCVVMTANGTVAYDQVFTAPQAGRDVVTTLNLDTQRLADQALAQSGRRGAVVIIDASTGDVRAMVSRPSFDPNIFAAGISSSAYEKLAGDINGPLFDRALQASYPPGSVFKPIVVLAGLRYGIVDAARTFECGPTLMIDGREFDNWSKDDHGWFNARAAIIRSCNTYFYQSAMAMGDAPILHMAREFGYGASPVLPLKATAGSLPARAPSNHDLANLSIGQGVTETSPLQVAMAMATIANGACRPRPRLVMQTQSQAGQTAHVTMPGREALIPVGESDLETVRHAMFGVVNHANGTGKAARLHKVPVFGKTGTAQWMLRGQKANVVWFAGYVNTTPPLAFAVTVEGNPGEGGLSGGGTAAPVIAKVLRDIEARPAVHAVSFTDGKVIEENDPLTAEPVVDLVLNPRPVAEPQRSNPVRGFFSRFFR